VSGSRTRRWAGLLLVVLAIAGVAAWLAVRAGALHPRAPAEQPWFDGDFEDGNLLAHWRPDWPKNRTDAIRIVNSPVHGGRHAAEVSLLAGDRGALKERVELTLGDETIERRHGGPGQEAWYAWSMLVPRDFEDLPPGSFHMVGQWHHRQPQGEVEVTGAPPLILHLEKRDGERVLTLWKRGAPYQRAKEIAARAVPTDRWVELLFHLRWSLGNDGFVEAWFDGKPWTAGKVYGNTLYRANGNYLRLGLYRGRGYHTTNRLFLDDVRIGPTRASVEG